MKFSLSFENDIAQLDGVVSGTMGGLKGIMIGVMIPQAGAYTITILLTVLFTLTWMMMLRRIIIQVNQLDDQQTKKKETVK